MTMNLDNSIELIEEGEIVKNTFMRDLFNAIMYAFLVLGLISAGIVYFVFTIKFLVEDYDTWKECDGSNLWLYVLVSLIISYNRTKVSSDKDDYYYLLCICFIELGFAIWGGIELFDNLGECPELRNSGLRDIALVTFILQLIVVSLFVLIPFTLFLVNTFVN